MITERTRGRNESISLECFYIIYKEVVYHWKADYDGLKMHIVNTRMTTKKIKV